MKAHHLLRLFAFVHAFDQTGNAVDQNVSIMHCSQPVNRRFDVDSYTVVLITTGSGIRLR